jgi:phage-related baseplate assembly protein
MTVDISNLPEPKFAEELSEEELRSELYDLLSSVDETGVFDDVQPGDPAAKVFDVMVLYRMILVQIVNESARETMIAYASETGLTILGSSRGVSRRVISAGDPDANPPIPPTLEHIETFRQRVAEAYEGFSTAGPRGAYIHHSKQADGRVFDVSVQTPIPGEVLVTILPQLADQADGVAIAAAVETYLSDEDIRPLGDVVTVQDATTIGYEIDVDVYLYPGPEYEPVLEEVRRRLEAYIERAYRLGFDLQPSAIAAAAHVVDVDGNSLVQKVVVNEPPETEVGVDEAPQSTAGDITITFGGYDK